MGDQDGDDKNSDCVDCPDCGRSIHKYGMGSHRNSRRCRVRQIYDEQKEKGRAKIGGSSQRRKQIEKYLKDVKGVEIHTFERNEKRRNGRPVIINYGHYADKEAVREAQEALLSPFQQGYAEKVEKIGETKKYLAVRMRPDFSSGRTQGEGEGRYFKKDEEGSLSQYVFLVDKSRLYTRDGFPVGKEVKQKEAPDKISARTTASMF